jgi:uncharacterized membrane protein YidH (DUF202 family)
MKNLTKKITIGLVIIMVVSLLLSFETVSTQVGKWTGIASDKISCYAKTVFIVALGLFLVSSGVAALAVPIVGIALIAVGLVLVAYAVWPFFSNKKSE